MENPRGIVGLGTDVVSVKRFEQVFERHRDRFLARVFTAAETSYAMSKRRPAESLAVRFAAKEACFKAVRAGWPNLGIRYQDVEVIRESSGAPGLTLTGKVAELAAALGAARWHVSLSHSDDVALAVVLLECAGGERAREVSAWTG